jgi:hypothetical protein
MERRCREQSEGLVRVSLQIYIDKKAEVHVGDIVRYVNWDYPTRGKFYKMTGTVTELRSGSVGIHFPHYARGTNLVAVTCDVRLVQCLHEKETA